MMMNEDLQLKESRLRRDRNRAAIALATVCRHHMAPDALPFPLRNALAAWEETPPTATGPERALALNDACQEAMTWEADLLPQILPRLDRWRNARHDHIAAEAALYRASTASERSQP